MRRKLAFSSARSRVTGGTSEAVSSCLSELFLGELGKLWALMGAGVWRARHLPSHWFPSLYLQRGQAPSTPTPPRGQGTPTTSLLKSQGTPTPHPPSYQGVKAFLPSTVPEDSYFLDLWFPHSYGKHQSL